MQMTVVYFAPFIRSLFPYDKTDKPYIAPELFTQLTTRYRPHKIPSHVRSHPLPTIMLSNNFNGSYIKTTLQWLAHSPMPSLKLQGFKFLLNVILFFYQSYEIISHFITRLINTAFKNTVTQENYWNTLQICIFQKH